MASIAGEISGFQNNFTVKRPFCKFILVGTSDSVSHHHLNVFWRGSSFDFDPIKGVDFAVLDQWGNMGAVSNYLSVLLALWERKGVGRGGSFNHNFAKLCSESPNWPPPSSQPLFLAI